VLQAKLAEQTSPVPYCMVLPPGELNSIIPVPLLIYSKSFLMVAVTVSL